MSNKYIYIRTTYLQGIEYGKKILKYYRTVVNGEKPKNPRQTQNWKKSDKSFRQRP